MPIDNLIIYLTSRMTDIAESMSDKQNNLHKRIEINILCCILFDALNNVVVLDDPE